MKQRSQWFLGVAWMCVVASAGPVAAQVCGNGVVEAPEECDDGGFCIGSSNAGTACRADADCPGGQCRAFGGDGCAANCTTERDVRFNLVPGVASSGVPSTLTPGTSGIVAEAGALAGISVAIPIEGTLTLTVGKERDGIVPAVVKGDGLAIPPVEVSLLTFSGCGCVKGAAAKTCGGTFQDSDGALSLDCTTNQNACQGKKPCAFVHGPGNMLSGVIGCSGLDGADFEFVIDAGGEEGTAGTPEITFQGRGGPGAARFLATLGLDILIGGKCTGNGTAYGPDGQFCTPDDRPDLSLVATNPAVTGRTAARVVNIGPDAEEFGPVAAQGAPFSCSRLVAGDPGGTRLVSAFAIPNLNPLGPVGVIIHLVAQDNEPTPPTCAGDCGGDGEVTVEEIVRMVNIALGSATVDQCRAGDVDGNGEITIDEIIAAVNRALAGC
jgi:hypothetical protein